MFCTSCGTKNAADSNYCKQCGRHLERRVAAAESEEAYRKALPDDEQIQSLLDRAYRLRREGQLAAAIEMCMAAVDLRPSGTSAHSLLGQLHAEKGDREAAISELERVLELNPGSIADRIRLDEIRSAVPADQAPRRRVVLTEPHRFARGAAVWPMRWIVVLSLAAGAAVTAFAYLRSRPAPEAARSAATSIGRGPQTQVAERDPHLPPVTTYDGHATVRDTMSPYTPQSGWTPGLFPPMQVYLTQGAAQRAGSAGPRAPAGLRRQEPPVATALTRAAGASLALTTPNREMLPAAPDQAMQGVDRVVIHVGPQGQSQTRPRTLTDETSGYGTGVTLAHPGSASTGSAAGSGAGGDARSLIAMGDSMRIRGDYTRAIAAYVRALPSAADQAAYIHENMGLCYQRKGDKQSAITQYNQAIADYKGLIAQGRRVDEARAGLSVCALGLKVCRSD